MPETEPLAPSLAAPVALAPARKNPFLAAVLAWFVPGLGHLYLGRPVKAAIFFACLTICFGIGGAALKFRNVNTAFTLHFIAQSGFGAPALALGWMNRDVKGEAVIEIAKQPAFEIGMLYTDIAGLLNYLIIVHTLLMADMTARKNDAIPPVPAPPAPAGSGA